MLRKDAANTAASQTGEMSWRLAQRCARASTGSSTKPVQNQNGSTAASATVHMDTALNPIHSQLQEAKQQ
jgi:hypothetical protein